MGREAKVKIEGANFVKRDRAQEEDEKFMARATQGIVSGSAPGKKRRALCVRTRKILDPSHDYY